MLITLKAKLKLVAAALLLASALPAAAAEVREGIGISPTAIKENLQAGQEQSGTVRVMNSGDVDIQYRLYASDFSIRNEDYDKDFKLPNRAGVVSPVSWFKLPAGARTLKAGAQETIDYTISVPDSAAPGGYYGVIFAETLAGAPDSTGIARAKRVGVLAYLAVGGELDQRGEFLGLDVDGWQQTKPLNAQARFKNSGNSHFDVTGQLRLLNVFGGKVAEAPLEGTLLPYTTRRFNLSFSPKTNLGIYRIEGQAQVLGQTHKLGPRWVLLASPLWAAILAGSALGVLWLLLSPLWRLKKGKRK